MRENPTLTSRCGIARAFGLKGAARIEPKALLSGMALDGAIEKHRRQMRPQGALPP